MLNLNQEAGLARRCILSFRQGASKNGNEPDAMHLKLLLKEHATAFIDAVFLENFTLM